MRHSTRHRIACCISVLIVLVGSPASSLPDQRSIEDANLIIVDNSLDRLLYHHEKEVNGFLGGFGFGLMRIELNVNGIHGFLNETDHIWTSGTFRYSDRVKDLVGLLIAEEPRVDPFAAKRGGRDGGVQCDKAKSPGGADPIGRTSAARTFRSRRSETWKCGRLIYLRSKPCCSYRLAMRW